MNVNELYDSIPEDQRGNIAVSADAVTITQADESVIVLLKATTDDNAELTDSAGAVVEPIQFEAMKAAASLCASKQSKLK